MPREPDQVAELIVRLEEILETEYDSALDIIRLEADLKVLASSLLYLLRSEEAQVFHTRHIMLHGEICIRCGKTAKQIQASSRDLGCLGEGI